MNESKHFFSEIVERLKLQVKPFNDLYFTYLLVFVIGIGGIGIWVSIFQELQKDVINEYNITFNIGTYFIALVSTSYIDLTTNDKITNKKSLQIYSFVMLIVLLFLFYLSNNCKPFWSIIFSIIGTFITLLVWHIANSENQKFNEENYNQKIRKEAAKTHGHNW